MMSRTRRAYYISEALGTRNTDGLRVMKPNSHRVLAVLVDALPYSSIDSFGFAWLESKSALVPGLGYSITQKAELLAGNVPDELGYFNHWQVIDPEPVALSRVAGSISRIRAIVPLVESVAWKILSRIGWGHMNVPMELWGRFREQSDGYYEDMEGSVFRCGSWSKVIGEYRQGHLRDLATVREASSLAQSESCGDHLFVSLAELDSLGHRFGVSSARFQAHGADLSRALEKLWHIWRDAGGTAAVFFSDHGMVDVTRGLRLDPRIFDLRGRRRAVHWVDSTIVRVWGEVSDLRLVEQRLVGAGVDVVPEEDRLRLGVATEVCGGILGVAPVGTMFAPNFFGARRAKGMHGYYPDEPSHFGMVGHCGTNETLPTLASTRDVYSLFRRILAS